MPKPDSGLMSLTDLPAALGLLSRLPVRVNTQRAAERGAKAAWAYPVVGAFLGFMVGVPVWALSGLIPAGILAALTLVAFVVLTGALHEDGLADTADGLWGGWDRARRLEIMKDSQIGSYGVIALVLSLLLRWLGLVAIINSGAVLAALIAIGLLSRGSMVMVMTALPNARDGGLSRSVGRPSPEAASIAALISVVGALACVGLLAVPMVIGVVFAAVIVAAIARAKIGGQTGDILGATQQVSEIVALVVLVSVTT